MLLVQGFIRDESGLPQSGAFPKLPSVCRAKAGEQPFESQWHMSAALKVLGGSSLF